MEKPSKTTLKFMNIKLFLLFSICFISCQPSIKNEANKAAKDYCDCLQKNLFRFDSSLNLYIHCTNEISNKYSLFELRLKQITGEINLDTIPLETKKRIDSFSHYFQKYSDNCLIPISQEDKF